MEQFATNAQTTLASAMNSTQLTLTVNSASGFSTSSGSGTFRVLVDNEIMEVTQTSGTTFTIVRGQEGTTAVAHQQGAPVTQIVTAAALQQLEADVFDNGVCDFRLTLSTGNPIYAPQPATPSSTNTGTGVVTFSSAHGWTTGTMVTVSVTGGGLTSGAIPPYWINALSTTTCAFYTSLANAEADTSRVTLSASITATIIPLGVQSTTVKLTPHGGNRIDLYDGAKWAPTSSGEVQSATLSVTASTLYYIYAYLSGSTLTFDISTTAWTLQDGVRVKTGDATRRFVGWLYPLANNTAEDSGGAWNYAGNRCLVNYYHRVRVPIQTIPNYANDNAYTTYTTTSTTYVAVTTTGGAGATCNFISTGEDEVDFSVTAAGTNTTNGQTCEAGLGIDGNVVAANACAAIGTVALNNSAFGCTKAMLLSQGAHKAALYVCVTAGTGTYYADLVRNGATFDIPCTGVWGSVVI
jgi:hypothetical protein